MDASQPSGTAECSSSSGHAAAGSDFQKIPARAGQAVLDVLCGTGAALRIPVQGAVQAISANQQQSQKQKFMPLKDKSSSH